jgi:NAD(P)-dependent dehydrogenase (short-subunit alcohol dehydrogenase family)
MKKLEGKVAVVTGGSSGMGFATAKIFVEEGAYVYIFGRRQRELDAAVTAIGKNITGVQGDTSNLADLDRLYAAIQQHHGYINVIFANAGVGNVAPLGAITEDHVDSIVNINFKGTLFTVQKALPLLQDGSSIVLNASFLTSRVWPMSTVYTATKSAVRSFARVWSAELLERKIRVNAISAGTVDSPFMKIGATDEENEQIRQGAIANIPMKRLATPDEIAKSVLFLASDDSSFITGTELFVDGGLTSSI